MFPLFGSWIADSLAGKFNAIYGSCLCYFVGACLIPVVAYDGDLFTLTMNVKCIFFAISLFLISIGTGGIKANISTFGAEQVAPYGETAIRRFFNWFYWLINFASLVSFSFIAYLQTKNFFFGYIPPVAAMFISLFLFALGRRKYVCKPANGSQLTDIIKILSHAVSRKLRYRSRVRSELPVGAELDLLDYAHVSFGGKYSSDQIDIVRCVGRITLVFLAMIIFWTTYFQVCVYFDCDLSKVCFFYTLSCLYLATGRLYFKLSFFRCLDLAYYFKTALFACFNMRALRNNYFRKRVKVREKG